MVEVSKLHCPLIENASSLFWLTVALDGASGIYQLNATKKDHLVPFILDKIYIYIYTIL